MATKQKPKRKPAKRAKRVKRVAAPTALRMYASARPSRFATGWGGVSTWSEDSELASSLVTLRARSRALVRDAAYAKRAKTIVVNNVIGPGIGLQALVSSTRDNLRDNVNDEIEELWDEWCRADCCHTGGTLAFPDLERAMMGQIFEAGEVFVRKHLRTFGSSIVPIALELIEAERIVDNAEAPAAPLAPGSQYRMGVEIDQFYRPIAYWVRSRHPSETRFAIQEDRVERIPADEIYHLRVVDRWPQTRAAPWLHAVAARLNDLDGYSEAEIEAARAAACIAGTIETPDESGANAIGTEQSDGSITVELEPGIFTRLRPGEKLNPYVPGRPNTALDPFMRYMLREIAAGANCSYESLSRDYSQSNYSSSRLSLLDDRDSWQAIQRWFIRAFRAEFHRDWLRQAVLSRALLTIGVSEFLANPRKFAAARFKPRGWSWIDPEKEVAALKEAVRCGFTTMSDVIAQTGNGDDFEDKIKRRAAELAMTEEAGLAFDTDPVPPEAAAEIEAAEEAAEPPEPEEPEPEEPEAEGQEAGEDEDEPDRGVVRLTLRR